MINLHEMYQVITDIQSNMDALDEDIIITNLRYDILDMNDGTKEVFMFQIYDRQITHMLSDYMIFKIDDKLTADYIYDKTTERIDRIMKGETFNGTEGM